MTIEIYDPVAEVQQAKATARGFIDAVKGKRVGYVFNQHTTAMHFWNHLERAVKAELAPSFEYKLYKDNTWRPAPETEMGAMIKEVDYALVGVGA